MSTGPSIFAANWRTPVKVRTAFTTAIEHGISGSEHRHGYKGTGTRSIQKLVQGTDQHESHALRSFLTRGSVSGQQIPFCSDQTRLTSAASAAATVINCDTTFRRLSAGKQVAIFVDQGSRVSTYEVRTILSLTTSTITLSVGLTGSYPAGALVIPLISGEMWLKSQGSVITNRYLEANLEALERIGTTQLSPVAQIGTTPSGFSTYGGVPVWLPPPDFGQQILLGVDRYGRGEVSGIDTLFTTEGDRGRATTQIPMRFFSRREFWDVLGLFESRGGSLLSFWALLPLEEFVVASATPTVITVEAEGDVTDWDFYEALGVIKTDGTVTMSTIDHVTRVGSQDVITLTDALSISSAADIDRMAVAVRSRFDGDELEEIWNTDQCVDCTVKLVEALQEHDITISNVTEIVTTDLVPVFTPDGRCITVHSYNDDFSGTLANWHQPTGTTWAIVAGQLACNVDPGVALPLTYTGFTAYTDCDISAEFWNAQSGFTASGIGARIVTGGGDLQTAGYMAFLLVEGLPPTFSTLQHILRLYRNGVIVATTPTVAMGITRAAFLLTDGDRIRLECVQGRIRVFRTKVSTGVESKILEYIDPSPLGPGKMGFNEQFKNVKYDNVRIRDLR